MTILGLPKRGGLLLLCLVMQTGCYTISFQDDGGAEQQEGATEPPGEDTTPEPSEELPDEDGDGWDSSEDCDDENPQVHPLAEEVCNAIDDNCNGVVDEGVEPSFWFLDQDGDGYGRDDSAQEACSSSPGWCEVGGDCDDTDPEVYPGSPALVDGLDSDCDGRRDLQVTLYVAVDDAGEVCIDGAETMLGPTGGWTTGTAYELWLTSGQHTLGIYGWDTGQVITAAIAHLETSDGQIWVSDGNWHYDSNPTAAEDSRTGWCEPFFDESSWNEVLDIGPIGTPPWGGGKPSTFPSDSPAHWIWDHFPVNLNSQYLRMDFELP